MFQHPYPTTLADGNVSIVFPPGWPKSFSGGPPPFVTETNGARPGQTTTSPTPTSGPQKTATTNTQSSSSPSQPAPFDLPGTICDQSGFESCISAIQQSLSGTCSGGDEACYCRSCNEGVRYCVALGCADEFQAQKYIANVNAVCSSSYNVPLAVNTAPVKGLAQSSGTSSKEQATGNNVTSKDSNSLSGGAIAGIVIGAIALVALLIALGWFLLRQRRRRRGTTTENTTRKTRDAAELEGNKEIREAAGHQTQESGGRQRHEADDSAEINELEGSHPKKDQFAHDIASEKWQYFTGSKTSSEKTDSPGTTKAETVISPVSEEGEVQRYTPVELDATEQSA